ATRGTRRGGVARPIWATPWDGARKSSRVRYLAPRPGDPAPPAPPGENHRHAPSWPFVFARPGVPGPAPLARTRRRGSPPGARPTGPAGDRRGRLRHARALGGRPGTPLAATELGMSARRGGASVARRRRPHLPSAGRTGQSSLE